MNLYEAIFVRKSIRSYSNEEVSTATINKIREHYYNMPSLFGGIHTDISILENRKSKIPFISPLGVKAPYYMLFYSDNASRHLMNAGFMMQSMSLYLSTLGLGSCILGNLRVKKSLHVKDGKVLVGIMAFGKGKGQLYRRHSEAKRLSMDEICVFREVPRQWMKQLLEAARMSPSSMNKQPWRFVVYDHKVHIFSRNDKNNHRIDEINFGVMFSHMMVAAEELWLDVDLIRLDEISQKKYENKKYILSAILKA